MKLNLQRGRKYFGLALIILFVEIIIGSYATGFIRTFFGDFLVVILLYALLRAFVNITPMISAIIVLAFSFSMELAQYFDIVNVIGLKGNRLAEIVIGMYFDPLDLLAYGLGVGVVFLVDSRYISE